MKLRKMLVVSGPSGAGKTTLIRKFLEDNKGTYELVKSVTTRNSRGAHDYYFHVSPEKFESYPGGFLETNTYAGHYYGTPRAEVFCIWESGRIPVLDIDVRGFRQIKSKVFETELVSVFILVSGETIYKRLLERGTETKESVIRRMRTAVQEIEAAEEYDFIIWNDELDRAAERLAAVAAGKEVKAENVDLQQFKNEMERIMNIEIVEQEDESRYT